MTRYSFHSPAPKRRALLIYCSFLAYFALILFLARLAFFVFIHDRLAGQPAHDILKALYIGFRFDLRWASILAFPIGLVLTLPPLRRLLRGYKTAAKIFYGFVLLLVWSLYFMDAGFFIYLGERLNSTIIELAADFKDGVSMIWQSYPVPGILAGLAALVLLTLWPVAKLMGVAVKECQSKKTAALGWICGFLIFAVSAYGQISTNYFPLRWSQAYFTTNADITAIALNPAQNLYDTYRSLRDDGFDLEATRAAYPLMAEYLGVDEPDIEQLNFARHYPARETAAVQKLGKSPNIVIIIMESFSWPKSSFGPGGLSEHTPYMKEFAKESLLFTNFYSNARTTARGVFSTMTGIPDVTQSSTGSRNQRVIDQRVVANEFKNYDKYYMLGGNTNWANIRGIIGNNIEGVKILEEGYWQASNIDVWGIHDYDLLMEAHDLLENLSGAEKPFMAVIQTASLHQPFTLPPNVPFERKKLTKEVQEAYGFLGEDEYNAFRFSDYAIHMFFEKAKKSSYYDNTIFFLFGDHSVNDINQNSPGGYRASGLFGWHVVGVLHAPWLIEPGVREDAASQIDVFPTLASLAGIEYTNWTLGRDLFSEKVLNEGNYAFISGKSDTQIRLVNDGYCFWDNRVGVQRLYNLEGDATDLKDDRPERFTRMRDLAWAYQVTAKYMLYNNKKQRAN